MPVINGMEVPELAFDSVSRNMAKQALTILQEVTQGWLAADKAAFWDALAAQIESRHSPAWTSTLLRGTNGEYVFSGGNFGVEGLVIDQAGRTYLIGRQVDVSIDLRTQRVTVTKQPPR
jgi:hypothetical protein